MPKTSEHPSLFEQDASASDSSEALASDLRSQLEAQAADAKMAAQAARGEVRGSSDTPDSAVYADYGGGRTEARENRLPKKPRPRIVTQGYSTELGRVVQSDLDIVEQRNNRLLADKRTGSRDQDDLDEDDKKRNKQGIEMLRAAIPPVPRKTWDRSHVVNEGDEVFDPGSQVGPEVYRRVENRPD